MALENPGSATSLPGFALRCRVIILIHGGPWGLFGNSMKLQPGDWVKTAKDEVGKVVHISRLTVFVALSNHPKPDRVEAFLESQLKKVAGQDRK